MAEEIAERAASGPVAGAARTGVAVAIGEVVARIIAYYDPGLAAAMGPGIVMLVAAAVTAVGKILRDRKKLFGLFL